MDAESETTTGNGRRVGAHLRVVGGPDLLATLPSEGSMDAWFEEDEEVLVYARDPY